jgi:hypothetical protein
MLDKVDGACSTCGRYRNSFMNLILKERYHLGDRHRWEDNIKVDIKERGLDVMDRIRPVQLGKVAGFCEHGNEPNGFIIS